MRYVSRRVFFEALFFTSAVLVATSVDKTNGTNNKFYRKVAILMYTEMSNFRPQS